MDAISEAPETLAIRPTAGDRPERKGPIFGGRPARKDQRSAVSNGRRLHVIPPGDTAWSRRFRDVLAEIISDMGSDGLSEGQRQLARRGATISIQCEKLEGIAAASGEIDLEQYGRLTDRLGRCFQRLGLKRQARDVGPTLSDFLPRASP